MAMLEILSPRGYPSVTLDGDRLTVGKSADNDLCIDTDPTLSRHHAVLERIGSAWLVSDLSSKNGTRLSGELIHSRKVLEHNDELVLGETTLLFLDAASANDESTQKKNRPPKLTASELEVGKLLCEPWKNGNAFTQPASANEIAAKRFTTEAATKNHLAHMYDKFGIPEEPKALRRARLANALWESGVVGPRDYADDDDDEDPDGSPT